MILLDLLLKMHFYNCFFTIIFLQNKSLDMSQDYQKIKSLERKREDMSSNGIVQFGGWMIGIEVSAFFS